MSTTTREIEDYVAAVHAALSDLPDAEREDLLDDLPQHLADVHADRSGALTDLLGMPEDYAAELRATAGLDVVAVDPWQSLRRRLTGLDERLGSILGYERFVDLLRALAPAWWLVRAYLAVEVCTAATQRSGTDLLVPEIGGNRVAGAVLLALALIGSVWLGRRGLVRNWQRITAVVLGIVLAVYGFALVRQATEPVQTYVDSVGDNTGTDTSSVSNIYPVGPDGSVLKNVRLYDQDGNPITIGSPCSNTGGDTRYFQIANPDDLGDPGIGSGISSADSPSYPLSCSTAPGPFSAVSASPQPASTSPAPSSSAPAPTSAAAPTPTPSR